MASGNMLLPVVEHDWYSGFTNLLKKEGSLWWRTRKWWVQLLVWLVISNGLIAFILWVIPLVDPTTASEIDAAGVKELINVFLQLETVFVPFGVMIHAQGLIVNEKKYGTAAWVLSNPVSRSSFIFSKLISHGWAMFIILVVIQSLLAYLQLALKAGTFIDPISFIAATGVLCVYLLFYLALALMLGALFRSTGPVIGIPIGLLVGMGILPQIFGERAPWLNLVLPIKLADLTTAIGTGQSLPANWFYPLISTAVLIVIFIALAVVRMAREEF